MHEPADDGNGYVDTGHVSITHLSADTWPRSVSQQHLSQDEVLSCANVNFATCHDARASVLKNIVTKYCVAHRHSTE